MDDDDKKSEDAAAEPTRDAAQEEGAKLRKVSEEDLKQILAAHETWLEAGGKEGKQADLSHTNLHGADLQGADLIYANLQGASLTKARNLTREQLKKACGDDKTKLPDDLADYKMKACPEPEQSPSN
jgi:uncharacterized protein YjbI with pentapeptide repeats